MTLAPLFRIECTIGDHRFEAAGPPEEVRAAYDEWRAAVAHAQQLKHDATVRELRHTHAPAEA